MDAKQYVYVYNRFISPGVRSNYIINVSYQKSTSESRVEAVTSLCRKSRTRFFTMGHSDASSLINLCTLTSSIKETALSKVFRATFLQQSALKRVVFWWMLLKSDIRGKFENDKFALHVEIELCNKNDTDIIVS